ncbi:hypothetical protein Sjap_022618 [Stephania japonica]|uniref:Uncharacterized protein n=1 Tax=Stephania japonica TaxID=461633 RepID=A0AAP0EPQ9_9MAGN
MLKCFRSPFQSDLKCSQSYFSTQLTNSLRSSSMRSRGGENGVMNMRTTRVHGRFEKEKKQWGFFILVETD